MTEKIIEIRTMITDNIRYLDYSDYERRLQIIEMRGRLLELRYNHNHDEKGRFCSGGGGGRMSSSSDKRLYSNGGAKPDKSIDKSKKSDIIENKEDIIADFKSSNFNGKINIPPRSIDVDKLNLDNNHINDERKHSVNEKQAKQFIKDAKISYTKYVDNIEFENYIGDNGSAYVDVNNNLIRTAFPKSQYTKGTQRILNTLSKYESGD